jgi:hypothetical protein
LATHARDRLQGCDSGCEKAASGNSRSGLCCLISLDDQINATSRGPLNDQGR